METFFTEKVIIKKIIIAIVFVFIFNFAFSYLGNNLVFASERGSAEIDEPYKDEVLEDGGGKLLLPIHDLVLFIADTILQLMQKSFLSSKDIIQKAKAEDMASFDADAVIFCVLAVVVVAVAVVYTAGTIATAGGAFAAATTTLTASGVSATTAAITAGAGIAKCIVRRNGCSWSSRNNCCC